MTPTILSTPYAVLSLFTTRFAASTEGIWVSFIEKFLFWIDIKLSASQIYHTHLFRWNLQICFPCICKLGCLGIFIKIYCSFNIEPRATVHNFVNIKDAPKLQWRYVETCVFVMFSWQGHQGNTSGVLFNFDCIPFPADCPSATGLSGTVWQSRLRRAKHIVDWYVLYLSDVNPVYDCVTVWHCWGGVDILWIRMHYIYLLLTPEVLKDHVSVISHLSNNEVWSVKYQSKS